MTANVGGFLFRALVPDAIVGRHAEALAECAHACLCVAAEDRELVAGLFELVDFRLRARPELLVGPKACERAAVCGEDDVAIGSSPRGRPFGGAELVVDLSEPLEEQEQEEEAREAGFCTLGKTVVGSVSIQTAGLPGGSGRFRIGPKISDCDVNVIWKEYSDPRDEKGARVIWISWWLLR